MSAYAGYVLVVDDDDDLRATIRELLVDEGYAVEEAGDGAQALARLRGPGRAALVLLDLMMPVMDGLEFRAAQRADPSLGTVPVVLMTAATWQDPITRVAADAVLRKPVAPGALVAEVERFAQRAEDRSTS